MVKEIEVNLRNLLPPKIPQQRDYSSLDQYLHDLECWIQQAVENKESLEKKLREKNEKVKKWELFFNGGYD